MRGFPQKSPKVDNFWKKNLDGANICENEKENPKMSIWVSATTTGFSIFSALWYPTPITIKMVVESTKQADSHR